MKRIGSRFLLTVVLALSAFVCYSQELIEVTDQSIKLSPQSEEILYFGFAAGDQIVFSCSAENNRDIRGVEIIEYPNNSKFSKAQLKGSIENKIILVQDDAVYIFKFKNTAPSSRTYNIHIQRIPASEATKNFNTTVTWETRQKQTETTYTKDVIVGYDTVYVPKSTWEPISTELEEEPIMNKTERLHSVRHKENSRSIPFSIPKSTLSLGESKELVGWAYWIGVGSESEEAWKKNVGIMKNVASGVATIVGAGPLAGLAIGAISDFAIPTKGDDVAYKITNANNRDITSGKGVAAYGKEARRTEGNYTIYIENDNDMRSIEVYLRISAIWRTIKYEKRSTTEMQVKPRYEKQTITEPNIKTYKVPIIGQ